MKNLNKINLIKTVVFGIVLVGMTTITVKGAPGPLSIVDGGTGTSTVPNVGQLLVGNGIGYSLSNLIAGAGMAISNSIEGIQIANNGVLSLVGTANQINTSSATGTIFLSLPQDIATSSAPSFHSLSLTTGGISFSDGTNQTSAAPMGIPVGTVVSYASTTIPNGWLLANGSAISRTNYPVLFSVIGTAYGEGDGSTTFNVPNFYRLASSWHMEGNSNDSSGNGNNGTDTAVTYGASYGKLGQGASFNGSSSYINIPDSASVDFNSIFSIQFWMNPDDVSNEQWLVGKGGGWGRKGFFSTIGNTAGVVRFGMGNGTTEALVDNGGFTAGAWYHIVMTYDGSLMRVYSNGVLLPNTNTNTFDYVNNYPVRIGGSDGTSLLPFNGSLDEVRIYDRTLSAIEIKNLYNQAEAIQMIKS